MADADGWRLSRTGAAMPAGTIVVVAVVVIFDILSTAVSSAVDRNASHPVLSVVYPARLSRKALLIDEDDARVRRPRGHGGLTVRRSGLPTRRNSIDQDSAHPGGRQLT